MIRDKKFSNEQRHQFKANDDESDDEKYKMIKREIDQIKQLILSNLQTEDLIAKPVTKKAAGNVKFENFQMQNKP